jgi:peptidyl-prolyl cis-trans isomerase D
MSIIQDIRDKYAKLTVAVIALALIGFILTDYFQSRTRMGRNTSNNVGSVNGRGIGFDEFNKKYKQVEDNMKQQGYPPAAVSAQALDQTWNQEISLMLLNDQSDKLGLTVGAKEKGDILYGANAPEDFKKAGTDEQGNYDPARAKRRVDEMMKDKKVSPEQKASVNDYIAQLLQQRIAEKYISLLTNSVNYPRWYVEKQNADNSQLAKIAYVKEVYTSIPDSAVKIEDKEIADYISKHKDDYKQQESRAISYVAFSAAPSAADSNNAKNSLLEVKAEFDSTSNVKEFLLRQNVNDYYDGYISGKTIQIAAKDSIFRTPVGSVYGPYLDGGSYVLARLEGVKQTADTAKVRHILISTQARDSATAYKLADSIRTAIANGANFDTLCAKYSDDGTKDKGGVYDNVFSGQMVPEFNDYIMQNPVGSKGIVKTDFGFHYIEILSQKGSSPGYKIAYLPKEIIASQATDDNANEEAQKFAGDVKDIKSFDEVFAKQLAPKGYKKEIAANIPRTGSQLNNVGISRQFIRSVYDAKVGEVLKPERVGESYVVAVVTEAVDEGTASVAMARASVEPLLRNKKKAALLKQKIGTITTLEAASAALGGKPIVNIDSLRMSGRNDSLGYEPRIAGAAFNPANKGKVVPEALEGVNGVFVVRVDNVSATPLATGNIQDQRKQMAAQIKQYYQNGLIEALRNAATIKDKRADRF